MLRPVKSWIGEISANNSLRPSLRNHSKESRWTLIRLGMGATSWIRANECRAAPSATARETGRASASAIGLVHTSVVRGDDGDDDEKNGNRDATINNRGASRGRAATRGRKGWGNGERRAAGA